MTVKSEVDGMVLNVHTLSKKKSHQRLSRMVKQNWSQTVAQLTAQYNAVPSRIVSEHTVQRTLLDKELRSKRPTCVPLLTKRQRQLRLRWTPGTSQLVHGSVGENHGQMNHGLSFITQMVVSGYAVFHTNSCSFNVQ
ncbi:HTH_Tnp_Tc3_2 domain-containing protein [Trichonephila clavipes]|nr:HTH_Tnp_Tc3_2 domain-containing protein [Trichonephila clavipes]